MDTSPLSDRGDHYSVICISLGSNSSIVHSYTFTLLHPEWVRVRNLLTWPTLPTLDFPTELGRSNRFHLLYSCFRKFLIFMLKWGVRDFWIMWQNKMAVSGLKSYAKFSILKYFILQLYFAHQWPFYIFLDLVRTWNLGRFACLCVTILESTNLAIEKFDFFTPHLFVCVYDLNQ